jgi:NAD(P)H-dependent flavin oxidoreductase YrpB (nitropropane dioxygenase family)
MEEPMRKISLWALAAAVILTGALGVWSASITDTQARIAATSSRIDPMQMMSGASNLATEHYADYSLVFN